MLGIPVCNYVVELRVTQSPTEPAPVPVYPGSPSVKHPGTNLRRHCQALCMLLRGGPREACFCVWSVCFFSLLPLPQNRGSFMVVCRGRVGLTAENWPSDKASSLQALTGNGARAETLGWLAQSKLGRAALVQVGIHTETVKEKLRRKL